MPKQKLRRPAEERRHWRSQVRGWLQAGAIALALVSSGGGARAAAPSYGAELEGFSYPHPVKTFALQSQRQSLRMTYLDVPPGGTANGRTAVLMHGKNFCAGSWGGTIDALRAAGFRVIAPDQIGFCKSSKPKSYQLTFQQLQLAPEALRKNLGVYAKLAPEAAARIPKAQLVMFDDLGHAPQIQDPARFHLALLESLAR